MHVLALAPALCLLLTPVSAQELLPPGAAPQVRHHGPIEAIEHVVYDVASATLRTVRVSAPGELALGSYCFDSSELSTPVLPVSSVVANPGEDLLNWGFKRCDGAALLRRFSFAYVSTAPASEGGAFSVALFSGATGFGQPGTEIFRRTFTDVPSGGGLILRVLTIDFGIDPLPLADGPFGWSYLQMDGATGPVLVVAPKPVLGTRDAMDIYRPGPARPANYVGTFNYGGCQVPNTLDPCASTWMQLDEIRPIELALTVELNGSGVNPQILHELLPARLGRTFAAAVDIPRPAPGFPPPTALLSSSAAASPVSTRYGELLIDLDQQVFAPLLGQGAYSFAIPADTALVGRRIFLQAALLPPEVPRITLTNALRVRVGY